MQEKRYTEADLLKAIDQTRESAKLHNKPSQETKDFMQETRDTFEEIKSKINDLPTAADIKIAVLEANKEFLKEAELRFASKWVERALSWGLYLIVAGFFGAVLYVIGWAKR